MHFQVYKTIFENISVYMNMRYLPLLALALSSVISTGVKAQGDSDPGFTMIGAMRPNSDLVFKSDEYENDKAQFSLGDGFAKGERNINLNLPEFGIRLPLEDVGYFDIRTSLKATNGELAKQVGWSDVLASFTYKMMNETYPDWSYQFTGGFMLGMGTADRTDGPGRPLPMAYQTNLGTTDLVLGASAKWKQYLTFAVGYQQPIYQHNSNGYFRSSTRNELIYSSSQYPISRRLYRNGDIMLRIEGYYGGDRAGISGGPLFIYHLRDDLYSDKFNNDAWVSIKGSQGMTLNLTADAFVRFGRYGTYKFDVMAAAPVATRTIAPEGLSRQWLIIPKLTIFFHQQTLLYERF